MTGSDQMLVWNQRESLEQPSERSPVSALLTLGKAREATLYAMSPLVVLGLKSQGLHEYFQFTRGESETQERFLRSPRSHSPNLQIPTRIPRTLKSRVWGKEVEVFTPPPIL